ncbi:MAG: hypothetical protein AAGI34_03750 [Pseudomonadota bacterium]
MQRLLSMACVAALLAGCAGREGRPVDVVRVSDNRLTCNQLQAEIRANTNEILALETEQSDTAARNAGMVVATIIAGWPALFAMDFNDAAGREGRALVERNRYLKETYSIRCDTTELRAAGVPLLGAPTSTAAASTSPSTAIPVRQRVATGPVVEQDGEVLGITGPTPYEGIPITAFNGVQMRAYCAETWETRAAPDGRTLYNPCRRPDAFSK